jgi:hypothetical protein
MTASKLKHLYQRNHPNGHFFDRKTMRFFGDTMANFGVLDGGKRELATALGVETTEVWVLYRKRSTVRGRAGRVAFFRKDNGQEVHDWD